VAEWVNLGTEAMNEAQRALGLSDERVARLIPVSTRTWLRWRQRGAVPVYMLDRVGAALKLEIERPSSGMIRLDPTDPAALEAILQRVEDVHAELREVHELVESLAATRPPPKSGTPRARREG
jgi:hypothetical protein